MILGRMHAVRRGRVRLGYRCCGGLMSAHDQRQRSCCTSHGNSSPKRYPQRRPDEPRSGRISRAQQCQSQLLARKKKNTRPVNLGRSSQANQASAHVVVATRDHALNKPAMNRRNVHAVSEDVQPTAAVTTTIPMRPNLSCVFACSRREQPTSRQRGIQGNCWRQALRQRLLSSLSAPERKERSKGESTHTHRHSQRGHSGRGNHDG